VIDVALRMLVHDRARFVITLVGVAFAVTLVIVQVGLFRGLLANATVTIEHADADLWITSKNTPNIDLPHFFSETSVVRIRSVPGIARADNLLVAFIGIQLPTGAEETVIVYGLADPLAWNLPWAVTEGRAERIQHGKSMLLDDSATRRFGAFAVGDRRELFGEGLDIVGRTEGGLSFTTMPLAFTSLDVAQSLEPNLYRGRTAYILVKLEPGADADAVASEIRRRLPYNDVYTRDAWANRTRDYWVTSTGLGMNMGLTVFLGILVGVTVVAQTLYAATLEHVREFGTMKAMGASNGHILGLIATQAGAAAIAGYLVAWPCIYAVRFGAKQLALDVAVTPAAAATVFVGALALCLAASFVTFRKIASIDPAIVFRT
jgi:putative ABC transport system permease protein